MSLYVGNLPSEAHAVDLERVFHKFGRCFIKMKDRYGFVVYENPSSAERALRTLRGTRIGGQAITLSWSNQQPHTAQRVGRGGKLYDPPRRRYFFDENSERRMVSNYQRGYGRVFRKAEGEVRRHVSSNSFDRLNNCQDDSKAHVVDRDQSPGNEDSAVKLAGANKLEDDRWEERVEDLSNLNYPENGIDFDTYEPYMSDDKKGVNEHQSTSPLSRSPSSRKRHKGPDAEDDESESSLVPSEVELREKKTEIRYKRRTRRRFESPDENDSDTGKGLSSSVVQSGQISSRSPLQESDGNNLHFRKEMIDSMNAHLFGEQLPVQDSHASMNASDEVRISSDELYRVLKHYGLPCPEENERGIPVEVYFGSSRLWPWEIIYYRRLKKGIVSDG